MVETLHPLDLVKGNLRMALGTVLPEFIFMNILVTIRAFSVSQAGKFLNLHAVLDGCFVTKLAINLGMFSEQGEFRLRMIKFYGRLK
jgi:ABC-type uncharacterized transport system permease subunit